MELSAEFTRFVSENLHSDVNTLRLKYAGKRNLNFDVDFAITQIDCRRRAKSKLPRHIANEHFLFPSTLSSEQSTSELLADFHASLITPGSSVLDMTCGLGIDSMSFAEHGATVKSFEINPLTADIVAHNIKACKIGSMEVVNRDSIDFLHDNTTHFDVIFVDPARRGSHNQRTFAFEDCSPDIIANFELIRKHCDQLIIKASPMLDITQIVRSLNYISDIWILCIKNECKEVLIRIDFVGCPQYHNVSVIDFSSEVEKSVISFRSDRQAGDITYIDILPSDISNYWLYEPNSGFMKTMAWDYLCSSFPRLRKLNLNTHLYIADCPYTDFPGRCLKIYDAVSPKELKTLKEKSFNIVVRTAPLSISDIKKLYRISEGGETFLYVCRAGKSGKVVAIIGK